MQSFSIVLSFSILIQDLSCKKEKFNKPRVMIAKTHKFGNLNDITSTSIKFRPIIDQTGFYNYNAVKVISDYMCTLCKTYIPSLIPNLLVNTSQIYHHYKMFHMMLNSYSQTYCKQLITSLNKFMDKVRSN